MRGFKNHFGENRHNPESLSESSWLSKGFALGQLNRHEQARQRLSSAAYKIRSVVVRAAMESDPSKQMRLLSEALETFANAMVSLGELSLSNINVAVATNLLEDDLKTALQRFKP